MEMACNGDVTWNWDRMAWNGDIPWNWDRDGMEWGHNMELGQRWHGMGTDDRHGGWNREQDV